MRLAKVYGHEEVLSGVIAEDGHLEELLSGLGIKRTAKPELEKKVRFGHDDHAGRLDIYQPTSIGDVIVEVQYGRADYHHADRLQNYAKNFHQTALVVWIAESFSNDMLHRFLGAKTPVYCVKASYLDGELVLKNRTPKAHVMAKQDKRIRQSTDKTLELIEVMEKWKTEHEMGMTWRQSCETYFLGYPEPLEEVRHLVDMKLYRYPKRTRQFLWTSPGFQEWKQRTADEYAMFKALG